MAAMITCMQIDGRCWGQCPSSKLLPTAIKAGAIEGDGRTSARRVDRIFEIDNLSTER